MLVSIEREGNQGSREHCAWACMRCGLLRWCLPQALAVLCGSPVSALKCMHGEGVQLMHLLSGFQMLMSFLWSALFHKSYACYHGRVLGVTLSYNAACELGQQALSGGSKNGLQASCRSMRFCSPHLPSRDPYFSAPDAQQQARASTSVEAWLSSRGEQASSANRAARSAAQA